MKSLESLLRQSLGESLEILAGPFALHRYPDWGEPAEPCAAVVGVDGGDWVVTSAAVDSHLHNRATADNQFTWDLGDVMELFLQVPGHEDYYEFHSTPEGRRLQLHLPDYLKLRETPFAAKICDCDLVVKNAVRDGVWFCEMRVPLARIEATAAKGLRYAVCRYNYGPDGEPELSTTMTDATRGFHNPPNWLVLGTKED